MGKITTLAFHKSATETPGFRVAFFFLENDEVTFDVWVFPHGIGVGVMFGVFSHPPRITDSHYTIGEDSRCVVVVFTGKEDLAVSCFMSNKRKLRHDDGNNRGKGDLDPGIAKEEHRRQRAEKGKWRAPQSR